MIVSGLRYSYGLVQNVASTTKEKLGFVPNVGKLSCVIALFVPLKQGVPPSSVRIAGSISMRFP